MNTVTSSLRSNWIEFEKLGIILDGNLHLEKNENEIIAREIMPIASTRNPIPIVTGYTLYTRDLIDFQLKEDTGDILSA